MAPDHAPGPLLLTHPDTPTHSPSLQQAGRDPEAVSQVLRDMLQVSCLIFCGEIVADAVSKKRRPLPPQRKMEPSVSCLL